MPWRSHPPKLVAKQINLKSTEVTWEKELGCVSAFWAGDEWNFGKPSSHTANPALLWIHVRSHQIKHLHLGLTDSPAPALWVSSLSSQPPFSLSPPAWQGPSQCAFSAVLPLI